jgi:hypothetical protein
MPPCTADQIKCATPAILAMLTLFLASGCSPQTDAAAPQPRPVRTVTVEQRAAGTTITLTGRIEAEDEVALAFRICSPQSDTATPQPRPVRTVTRTWRSFEAALGGVRIATPSEHLILRDGDIFIKA